MRSRKAGVVAPFSFTCDCGKRVYVRKDDARRARRMLADGLHVYRACDGNGWHIGHMSTRATRDRYREGAA